MSWFRERQMGVENSWERKTCIKPLSKHGFGPPPPFRFVRALLCSSGETDTDQTIPLSEAQNFKTGSGGRTLFLFPIPKGRKIEKTISLESFNLAWKTQSRLKILILTFRIPTNIKWGFCRHTRKIQTHLKISIPEGDLEIFQLSQSLP